MSAVWARETCPIGLLPENDNATGRAAAAPCNEFSEPPAVESWALHPSRVEDGSKEQPWISDIRREPRQSCIVSSGAERRKSSPCVQICHTPRESDVKQETVKHSSMQECVQSTLSSAVSFVKTGRWSSRFTAAQHSVLTSIPTFDIREPTTPQNEKELKRIYPLEDPTDESVWSYLSSVAKIVGVAMCLIALWTMWFASFFTAFASVYAVCKPLLYLDTVLDLFYLIGIFLEFNISVINRERRTEVQHRGTIIDIHVRSPSFYGDILSCFISPLLINRDLSALKAVSKS